MLFNILQYWVPSCYVLRVLVGAHGECRFFGDLLQLPYAVCKAESVRRRHIWLRVERYVIIKYALSRSNYEVPVSVA